MSSFQPIHLLRRLTESASRAEVSSADLHWAEQRLTETEYELWSSMQNMDRRHSIRVARRLVDSSPHVERFEIAAALLHDVGKVCSSLSVIGRVVATLVGPRTARWSAYHDHEAIGAALCRDRRIDPRICDLIEGLGPSLAVERLRSADDI